MFLNYMVVYPLDTGLSFRVSERRVYVMGEEEKK